MFTETKRFNAYPYLIVGNINLVYISSLFMYFGEELEQLNDHIASYSYF